MAVELVDALERDSGDLIRRERVIRRLHRNRWDTIQLAELKLAREPCRRDVWLELVRQQARERRLFAATRVPPEVADSPKRLLVDLDPGTVRKGVAHVADRELDEPANEEPGIGRFGIEDAGIVGEVRCVWPALRRRARRSGPGTAPGCPASPRCAARRRSYRRSPRPTPRSRRGPADTGASRAGSSARRGG